MTPERTPCILLKFNRLPEGRFQQRSHSGLVSADNLKLKKSTPHHGTCIAREKQEEGSNAHNHSIQPRNRKDCSQLAMASSGRTSRCSARPWPYVWTATRWRSAARHSLRNRGNERNDRISSHTARKGITKKALHPFERAQGQSQGGNAQDGLSRGRKSPRPVEPEGSGNLCCKRVIAPTRHQCPRRVKYCRSHAKNCQPPTPTATSTPPT